MQHAPEYVRYTPDNPIVKEILDKKPRLWYNFSGRDEIPPEKEELTMTFTETWRGHWESNRMGISAAIITRDDEGNSTGLVHDSVALYEIEEGEYKSQMVYRLYKNHLGGRSFMKRFKTLEQAIKFAEADDKK